MPRERGFKMLSHMPPRSSRRLRVYFSITKFAIPFRQIANDTLFGTPSVFVAFDLRPVCVGELGERLPPRLPEVRGVRNGQRGGTLRSRGVRKGRRRARLSIFGPAGQGALFKRTGAASRGLCRSFFPASALVRRPLERVFDVFLADERRVLASGVLDERL